MFLAPDVDMADPHFSSVSPGILGRLTEEGEKPDNYALCQELRADRDADLGRLLKAGCEPTLAQMSRLMDNPIGNVAMLFNQYDAYSVKEPESGIDEFQHNYMLLAQFPKKLSKDWT